MPLCSVFHLPQSVRQPVSKTFHSIPWTASDNMLGCEINAEKSQQIHSQVKSTKLKFFQENLVGKRSDFLVKDNIFNRAADRHYWISQAVISFIKWNIWSVCAAAWSFSASLAPSDCFKTVTREKRQDYKHSGKLWVFHKTLLTATTTWLHTF